MGITQKSCCHADTLFFPFEQKTGRSAIEEIKRIAPAYRTPADAAPRSKTTPLPPW
jgi:hypothetical protein